MSEVFHVYASQGRVNYAELDLPASDYEMLDLMERLRLEPGQPPYVEVLKIREEYNYLDKCLPELPDIYQLNALARKLAGFTSIQEMAAFEGMAGKEAQKGSAPIELTRLIDFAHSTDCCVVAENATTDYQLGKFLVDNDFIEEASGLPDSALALLDYAKIGREHREQTGGVYTGFGYVERQSEIHCVSKDMDLQPRKPSYTVLLNTAALPLTGGGKQSEVIQLRLPAPQAQIQDALQRLGKQDWKDVAASIQDCAIPWLNHKMYFDGETPQILELSQRLADLDAQGQLTRYKAILAANNCDELSRAISLASMVDEHFFEPKASSPEDVAREELAVVICERDAETLVPHIDLQGYGRALLERDHAVITGYGLLERKGGEPVQRMRQQPGPGGMEML